MSEIASLEKTSRCRNRQRRNSPTPNDNNDEATITQLTCGLLLSTVLDMASPIRLLVCSIGNPGPYLNTLHSAGHTVLNSLASSLSYPSFQKSRAYGNGFISLGLDFTLWQSSSLMNISGVGVAAAWRQFAKDYRGEEVKLVVVHDELELALGQVKVKSGTASPKGHNGLKSIKEALRGVDYTRIGVGIGRPESRDPNIVAGYVLKKMSVVEKGRVEGCADRVEMELRRLRG